VTDDQFKKSGIPEDGMRHAIACALEKENPPEALYNLCRSIERQSFDTGLLTVQCEIIEALGLRRRFAAFGI
jgi:hypothetical protein